MMYADYLRENNNLRNHKHMQPIEANPPVRPGLPGFVGGALTIRTTPRQQEAIRKRAEKLKAIRPNYIRNEIVREIQKDLRLA